MVMLAAVLALGLVACGDDFESQDASDGGTYLVVGNASVARTIMPDENLAKTDALTDIVLKGTLTSEADSVEKTLAEAEKFADLAGKRIPIRTGTWSFALSAKLNGIAFSGTLDDIIIEANETNTVAFTLTAVENHAGLSVTVQFPKDENVTKVKATLTKRNDATFTAIEQEFCKVNADETSDFAEVTDESGAAGSVEKYAVTFARSMGSVAERLEGDAYSLVFDFYAEGTDDAINSIPYEVLVVAGFTTTGTDSIILNETYDVNYGFYANGERLDDDLSVSGIRLANAPAGSAGLVLPGKFSRKSSTITLPDLQKDGFVFAGWYEDSACKKTISEIPAGSTGAKNLRAAFINAITVSAKGKADANVLVGEPMDSVTAAAEKIVALKEELSAHWKYADWKIYVDGKVTGEQTIGEWNKYMFSNVTMNSFTIEGKNGIDEATGKPKDSLDGGFDSDNNGTTLTIISYYEVTIKNLLITGGYNTKGAGLEVWGSQTYVTLGEGSRIEGNHSTGEGAGIYNTQAHVTIKSGAVITGNTASSGGGIYLHTNGAYYTIDGGTINGNTNLSGESDDVLYATQDTSGTRRFYIGGDADIGTIYLDWKSRGIDIKSPLTKEGLQIALKIYADCAHVTSGDQILFAYSSSVNLADECGKFVIPNKQTKDSSGATLPTPISWCVDAEGKLRPISDVEGIASQIEAMTESGTVTISGYMKNEDIASLNGALKNLYSAKPSVMVTLDMSGVVGLTEIPKYGFTQTTSSGLKNLAGISLPASVKTIGGYAFYGCSNLETLTLSEGLETIGFVAFRGCTKLTSLTIPDSVTSLGTEVFLYCTGLTSVVLGHGITNLEAGVFNNCTGLTTITLPASLKTINFNSAFRQCTNLTEFIVEEGNQYFSAENGVLFNKDKTKLITYPSCSGSYEIPSGVTSISGAVFYGCTGLTSVIIPNTVTTIDSYAFALCDHLTSISIPDSVTSIGSDCFSGCSGLTSLEIGSGLTNLGGYALNGCSSLVNITVSSGNITYSAENGALFNKEKTTLIICPACPSVYTVPDGVTTFGTGAFRYCLNLETIILPSSVESIPDYTFESCSSLTKVFYKGTEEQKEALFANISDTTIKKTSIIWICNYGSIGSKEPDTVGDIVFADGTAVAYSADLTLTDGQKAAAVAVIFYVGTDCSNKSTTYGADTDTGDANGTQLSRTLGVSLSENSGLAWCDSSAMAASREVGQIEETSATLYECDKNGSDNYAKIGAFLKACEVEDDTDPDKYGLKYPAFDYAAKYLTGDSWYIPTLREFHELNSNMSTITAAFDLIGGVTAISGKYWTSNQAPTAAKAWYFDFDKTEEATSDTKTESHKVRAVRAF